MRRIMRIFMGVTAAAVVIVTAGTPAHADPGHSKHALLLQIGCDNEQAYAAVTNGKHRLAAIHDVTDTAVLVPVSVSRALVTVLDQDLNVLDQWTDPSAAKPSKGKHHQKALLTCNVIGFQPRPDGTTMTVQEKMTLFVTHPR
jgi:hypothetical protein